jgi:polyhydroxybutyrate depolymerase
LLLFLHGLGGSGRNAFDVLQLAELGRRYQTFVLAPDGSMDREGRLFWNAHPACCNFDGQKVDHVAYLDQVLNVMVHDYPVDRARIFVIGFSNGGFMAHRLACEWGDRLAGIASVAGAGPEADAHCQAASKLRVLELHGDADVTVRYGGGTPFDRPGIRYGSARATLTNWARRMRCEGAPVASSPIDVVPGIAGKETDRLSHERCPGGSASLWTVHRGSHMAGNHPLVIEEALQYLSPAPAK